ncbi:Hsp70 family protein [Corynebacterium freiburgense]|uniref:Hsp70 family protein n=1 Tax=Corynebacterium freiburgense TaxID=556548 RepID=UPI000405B945|nr:Hsp70 family protein [Corynebacterium freiburgense]WJZ03080.1 Chaperone protein DnaK [Corynebacterium freiburgense]
MGFLGIDLGTTFCCVSHINELGQAVVVRNSEGSNTTPSVVLFNEDETYIGQTAKSQRTMFADNIVEFIKNEMGNSSWRTYSPNGTEHTPETISSLILRKLVDDANLLLGANYKEVVITVPAYFDDQRRFATQQAAELAGLNVLGLVNEPTAAALSFGVEKNFKGSLLVYDLGGGTFDVTLVDVNHSNYDVVASVGDRNLGGRDWDNELINYLRREFKSTTGIEIPFEPEDEAMLRDRAEAAKLALTQSQKTAVFLSYKGTSQKVVITRQDFERITKDLLQRTSYIVDEVLDEANRQMSDISKVVLVGGSTRMPMVSRMLQEEYGANVDRSVHPDEAVAIGAGIYGITLTKQNTNIDDSDSDESLWLDQTPIISDVTSHGLGTTALNDDQVMENYVLIPAQSKIPARNSQVFFTVRDQQAQVEIVVTVGDESDVEYVTIIGSSVIDLPPLPVKSPIRVVFNYDIDGIVHVEVFNELNDAFLGEFPVQRQSGLSEEELDKFKDIVSKMDVQ